jgi:hypothetical protein
LTVDKKGNLSVGLRFTEVTFNIPEAYQVGVNGKEPADVRFKKLTGNRVAFAVGSPIKPELPLVIDPVLVWGTYMDGNTTNGNTFDQYLYAIALDSATNILYCAGATNINIPTSGGQGYDADGWRNTVTGLNRGHNLSHIPDQFHRK